MDCSGFRLPQVCVADLVTGKRDSFCTVHCNTSIIIFDMEGTEPYNKDIPFLLAGVKALCIVLWSASDARGFSYPLIG